MRLVVLGAIGVSIAIHELGHARAARARGVPVHDVVVLPIAGWVAYPRDEVGSRTRAAIAWAGPAANLSFAVGALGAGRIIGWASDHGGAGSQLLLATHAILEATAVISALLGAVNLIPIGVLDGADVAAGIVSPAMRPYVRQVTRAAGPLAAGALLVVSVRSGLTFARCWDLVLVGLVAAGGLLRDD